jgi:hypothetical protein
MKDRSLSRHAITFFALRAILTQAATLAILEFGLQIADEEREWGVGNREWGVVK